MYMNVYTPPHEFGRDRLIVQAILLMMNIRRGNFRTHFVSTRSGRANERYETFEDYRKKFDTVNSSYFTEKFRRGIYYTSSSCPILS